MTFATNFWTKPGAADPKRSFRFKVIFGGNAIWWAKTADQPVATVSAGAEFDFLIHKFYYPGKVTWNDVNVTLVDPVTPGALDSLMATLYRTGYRIPESPNDASFTSISKAGATGALGTVEIIVIDSEGKDLHSWKLNNAFIMEVSPGALDYASEDLMEITLGLKYDWATYTSYLDPATGARNEEGSRYFTTSDNTPDALNRTFPKPDGEVAEGSRPAIPGAPSDPATRNLS